VTMLEGFELPQELERLRMAVADAQLEWERAKAQRIAQNRLAQANETAKKTIWNSAQRTEGSHRAGKEACSEGRGPRRNHL